jgi:parallel beta-helix repeat protein
VPGDPAAFMSYARFNDEHDDGQLSAFRQRLSAEVRAQTGEEFAIFQDRNDIAWGQNWQQRIDETLDAVTLLLVIITPGLFRSQACRAEVTRFLERERALGRGDLILPVYYISAREMDDPGARETDELARVLAARQLADWRELRFEAFTTPAVRKAVAQLAARMRDVFWHLPIAAPARAPRTGQTASSPAQAERAGTTARVIAKTEPSTHVVDAYQRGDFASVGAAIAAARPGDRILVRPGLYEEALVVDKPLEILGDGPVADIEIRARDASTLSFKASIGRVANLTLRQAGGDSTWYGADITHGRLNLEGCDISSQAGACVAIHDGADPRLRRNHIHDGKQVGVYFHDGGRGTLEDNDISGSTFTGVEITSGADPTLRRNQINNGVFVQDNGRGTLEDNDISGNGLPCVEIKTGADPVLRHNHIHGSKQAGVFVQDGGRGTLEDNDISGNALAGVAIKTGGDPILRRNQIHDSEQYAVFVYDDGRGTLEDNNISGNGAAGVTIMRGGDPTLRHNKINRNGFSGVMIFDGGRGTLEDNDLTDNAEGAWRIDKDCRDNVTRARNKE